MRKRIGEAITNYMWHLLEPRVQAAITDRLIEFYQGLIERRQIAEAIGQAIRTTHSAGDAVCSAADCATELGRVLPFSARPHPGLPDDSERA